MALLSGDPMVLVWRGASVESVHAVAACVCDDRGVVQLQRGTIDVPVFLRSSAKPFIAAAVVRAGAADRFGLTPRELAVMAASHNGESGHVAAVESILGKIGASVADLACGAHAPAYEPAAATLAASGAPPTALHNNCSGKHAGMLALARVLDVPLAGYLSVEHPVQQAVLGLCERVSDDRFSPDRIGVDGCGVPVYATPLRNAALSFARFATLRGVDDADASALLRVRDAMAAEPWYVGGTARFDTDLIAMTRGRIVGKAGAEGVHCDAVLDLGLGLACKVIDGTRRAMPPAAFALLRELGALDDAAAQALAGHAEPSIRNVADAVVGRITVVEPVRSQGATLAPRAESITT